MLGCYRSVFFYSFNLSRNFIFVFVIRLVFFGGQVSGSIFRPGFEFKPLSPSSTHILWVDLGLGWASGRFRTMGPFYTCTPTRHACLCAF